MIPKRSIVRMLCDSHDLDCIIPKLMDSRKNIIRKLRESMHSWLNTSHSDMSFVDFKRCRLLRSRVLKYEWILWSQVDDTVKQGAVFVLNDSMSPNGNAIYPLVCLCAYVCLDPRISTNRQFSFRVLQWQPNFPVPEAIRRQRVFLSVPRIKITS